MKKSAGLYEIQKTIQGLIQNSLVASDTDQELKRVSPILKEKPPISIKERMGIYKNAYKIRMLESLRDDFSRVENHLGSEQFNFWALRYADEYRSKYSNLAEFGQFFSDFLRTVSEDLYELASLDWIEILANTSKRYDLKRAITTEELGQGRAFKFIRNPTLYAFKGRNAMTVAYCVLEDVLIVNVGAFDFEILETLKSPTTFEELSKYFEVSKWQETEILNGIEKLIKDQMIFCERIEYI